MDAELVIAEMWFGVSMAQYLMFMSTSLVFLAVAALAVNVLAWRE